MKTQTSLVAEQIRLQQWAEQIKDCQARPVSMKVETWCEQNGITKANSYYRLRRVRETCLALTQNNSPHFMELPALTGSNLIGMSIPGPITPPPMGPPQRNIHMEPVIQEPIRMNRSKIS